MQSIINKAKKTLNKIEKSNFDLRNQIIQFFLSNPNPVDQQIHQFAETLGLSFDELENIIYQMFTSFVESLDNCRTKEVIYSETAYTENDEVIDTFIDSLYHSVKNIDPNLSFESDHSPNLSVVNISGKLPDYHYLVDKAISYSKIPRNTVNVVRRGKTISVRIKH